MTCAGLLIIPAVIPAAGIFFYFAGGIVKPVEIAVGKTYVNRGAGKTQRKVLRIGKDIKAPWYSRAPRPDEMVVEFVTIKNSGIVSEKSTLYISSFASWASNERAKTNSAGGA